MSSVNRVSTSKKVLVVSDGKHGPTATQKISFGQPFDPARGPHPVEVALEKDYAQPDEIARVFAMHAPDLLLLSRFGPERGLVWIGLARQAGIPVIFHIDDDLLAVPASLGEAKFKMYNDPARLAALRENIERSDLIYVSTAELGRRFKKHGIRTPIMAGDIYCSVAPGQVGALIPPATGPVIGYMGTGGHAADLDMIMPAICEVMDSVPDLQFEVFGTIAMPDGLARFGRRVRHLAPVADYADFIPYLRSLGWWIGLAPLEDNDFNRCKANTKWVEYSLAGMAVIASELPAYRHSCADQCGMLAGDKEEWKDAMLTLLLRPDIRSTMIEKAQDKLRQSYTHDHLRSQILTIFDAAFAKHGPSQL